MKSVSKTVPVTKDGSKTNFHLPYAPPDVILKGNTLVATLQGGIVHSSRRVF